MSDAGGCRTLDVMAAECWTRWPQNAGRETLKLVGRQASDVGRKWIGRDILLPLKRPPTSVLSVYRLA